MVSSSAPLHHPHHHHQHPQHPQHQPYQDYHHHHHPQQQLHHHAALNGHPTKPASMASSESHHGQGHGHGRTPSTSSRHPPPPPSAYAFPPHHHPHPEQEPFHPHPNSHPHPHAQAHVHAPAEAHARRPSHPQASFASHQDPIEPASSAPRQQPHPHSHSRSHSRSHPRSHSRSHSRTMSSSLAYPSALKDHLSPRSGQTHNPSSYHPSYPSSPRMGSSAHLHQRSALHPHPYHPPTPVRPHGHSRQSSLAQSTMEMAPPSAPASLPQETMHSSFPPHPPGATHSSGSGSYPSYPLKNEHSIQQPPVVAPRPLPTEKDVEDEDEDDGEIKPLSTQARPSRVQGGSRSGWGMSMAEEEPTEGNKCVDCGKEYKHPSCLGKHRWEHSIYWKSATKFLLSKHQQVRLMEAASILLGMDSSRDPDKDEIVRKTIQQRGSSSTLTSSSVSPPISNKSLSVSPPPMPESYESMDQDSDILASMRTESGPATKGTLQLSSRQSIVSTTSTSSSSSSTPPSLAADDESVMGADDDHALAAPRRPHRPSASYVGHAHNRPSQQHPVHIVKGTRIEGDAAMAMPLPMNLHTKHNYATQDVSYYGQSHHPSYTYDPHQQPESHAYRH